MSVSRGEAPDPQAEQRAASFGSQDRRSENFLETIFEKPPPVQDDFGRMHVNKGSDYHQANLALPSVPGVPSDSGYGSEIVCNCQWPCNYIDPTAKCTGQGSKDAFVTGALDIGDGTMEWLNTDYLRDELYDP